MKIKYFFRHSEVGFSIQKVFKTTINEIEKYEEVDIIEMPRKGSMPWDLIFNWFHTHKNREKQQINHITGHIHDVITVLPFCKTILTIHDLVFLDHIKNPFVKIYKYLFWFYIPIKFASKITCISYETKNNIEKRIASKKIVVIPNPISPNFKYTPKEFNKKEPTILHIGTGWNKNLLKTIQALEGTPCHLRIIGKLSTEVEKELKLRNVIYSNAYNIDDEAITKEYLNSDIVSFPSIYEGFGMPIVEAQKTGRVVLTSSLEPMKEVSGNAAVLVNPHDIQSIKNGFQKIINSPQLRELLIHNGLKNAQKYSVNEIANSYIEVYKEILSN